MDLWACAYFPELNFEQRQISLGLNSKKIQTYIQFQKFTFKILSFCEDSNWQGSIFEIPFKNLMNLLLFGLNF